MVEPHWEHGWRSHGLWNGPCEQVGYIGLTPPGFLVEYSCYANDKADHKIGCVSDLRKAKRIVEEYVKAHNVTTEYHSVS